MKEKFDIIVIGAGIIGVSTALNLQEKGKSVLLIDKIGAGKETSYGNSGVIGSTYVMPFAAPDLKDIFKIMLGNLPAARMSYPSCFKEIPWIIDLYIKSFDKFRIENGKKLRPLVKGAVLEHKKLISGTGVENLISDNGKVILYRSKKLFEKSNLYRKQAKELGVELEILTRQELKEIEPVIKSDFYRAVKDGCGGASLVDPGAVVEAYANKFVKNGGNFKIDKVKNLIKLNNAWQVETETMNITSEAVILCTGPWANELLKPFNVKLPIGIKRGYHKHFKLLSGKLDHVLVDAANGYLMMPTRNSIRITTGAEFAARNARRNPIQIEQVLPKAKDILPLGDSLDSEAWVGSRPCTADSLPIIDEISKHKGLWVNLGHGHIGMTIGPSCGRLMAEKITAEKTFCDIDSYSLKRFGS